MEELHSDDDQDQLHIFMARRQDRLYKIKIKKQELLISSVDKKDKIRVSLNIQTTICWLEENNRILAFGLEHRDLIEYFFAEEYQLLILRSVIRCKVSFGLFHQDYYELEQIGRGSFSEVISVADLKEGNQFALKKVKVWNEDQLSHLQAEVNILRTLNHEGIPKLYDVYKLGDHQYGLVIELVEGKSLDSILSKQKNKNCNLEEKDIQMILKQTLEIVLYLHQNKIIHRDLKPQHIILTKQQKIKVIDFGLSYQGVTQFGTCGTPGYLPPESFSQLHKCTSKSDIFSIGIVLYRLMNKGISCFEANTVEQLLAKNKQCQIEFSINGYSNEATVNIKLQKAKQLLKLMLQKDPFLRINCIDALNHKFFKNFVEDSNCCEYKNDIYVYQNTAKPSRISRK